MEKKKELKKTAASDSKQNDVKTEIGQDNLSEVSAGAENLDDSKAETKSAEAKNFGSRLG